MAYEKQTWTNLPSKTTPINADRLNHMEQGIYDNDQNKVDKVTGKGLSTNDFDNTYKSKVDGLYAPIITGTQIEF